jgi:DNA helicase-2/ATP-dependent DNA helicase PcrA
MDTLCVSAPGTPDTRIEVLRATAAGDQSAVVSVIEQWRGGGRDYRECAVLARLWAQTLGLELELLVRGIPYHKPKGDVFAVTEVMGLLGWLRLASGTLFDHPHASEIIRAMLATPTLWLPSKTLGELADAMVRAPDRARSLLLAVADRSRKPFHAVQIRERAAIWGEARQWGKLSPAELLRTYAARTDMAELFSRSASTDTASEKEIAYETLLGAALRTRAGVRDFLAHMDRLAQARKRYEAGGDVVLLSTIHQAKG